MTTERRSQSPSQPAARRPEPSNQRVRLGPPSPPAVRLQPGRIERAKRSYATRRIPSESIATLLVGSRRPQPGDLVLARVEKLRQHKRLELPNGRRADLFRGDEIVVSYGHRYAPDQFEAEVPEDLSPCHLVAAGGVAAVALSRHGAISPATEIAPIGLLGDADGEVLNLAGWSLPTPIASRQRPLTVAVAGTSMNSGKTTTAAHLIRGLRSAGLTVGAAKVTGTGAGGDFWKMTDAGAELVLDFTDAGFASTYKLQPAEVLGIFRTLVVHLSLASVDAIVLEVADGLLQDETAALLASATFRQQVDALLFAAADALGAHSGLDWLADRGLPVVALSGSFTQSPLAVREAASFTTLPVLGLEALSSARVARLLDPKVHVVAEAGA